MRLQGTKLTALLTGAFIAGTVSCTTPPLASPEARVIVQTPIRVAQNLKNKVDILFVVDSSNSMDAMSAELRNKFPQFFKVFTDLAENPAGGTFADLHVGVIDTDYGAGATGAPGCTPSGLNGGGTQGKLQAVGKAAAMGCKKPTGANYIQYEFKPDGTSASNLPMG